MNILGMVVELLLIILIACYSRSVNLIFIRKTKLYILNLNEDQHFMEEQTIDIDDDIEELKNIKESLSDVSEKLQNHLKNLKVWINKF